MADEHLVEVVVGDLQRRDALGRAGADVEQELIAVAELDEPACCRLFGARVGHAGAAGEETDPIFLQRFRTGVVRVTVEGRPRR